MNNLTIEENLEILNSYNCSQTENIKLESDCPKGLASHRATASQTKRDLSSVSGDKQPTDQKKLRQALLSIVNLSEWQNVGICADNSEEGFRALFAYLKAFGYQYNLNKDAIEVKDNPIYIKFNSQRMSHYIDDYIGEYRGVLISCKSEDDKLSGTYGHFPLDLFNCS